MKTSKGFTYPTAAKCEEITIFDQKQPFETLNVTMVSVDHIQFLFKRYNNYFYVAVNAFWPWQKQNSDFQFLAFPIGYVGGLRWEWGLKTNFKIFLNGLFVQEESSGTCFDHGQFEIKTFPIYAPP